MSLRLTTPISDLPGIGPKRLGDFVRLGIQSVREFLFTFPHRYEDYTQIKPIPQLRHGDRVTVAGRILSISTRPGKRPGMKITEAILENETGRLPLTWFNQPYLEKTLKPRTEVSLAGTIDARFSGRKLVSPIWELPNHRGTRRTGCILPVYPLAGSLTLQFMRDLAAHVLSLVDQIEEWVPEQVVADLRLPACSTAIRAMHAPERISDIQPALARMAFEEVFLHQLLLTRVRKDRERHASVSIPADVGAMKQRIIQLPFALTMDQKRALWACMQDMEKETPMNRLLQGDVGSGKTVVAVLLAAAAASAGQQSAYLAPTEVLAAQQFEVFKKFAPELRIALLTSSQVRNEVVPRGAPVSGQPHGFVASQAHRGAPRPETPTRPMLRSELFDFVRNGGLDVVVGTHALLSEHLQWKSLGLVVIDEQHRFGVEQRHRLLSAGATVPHLLSMTATPIPRSLALSVYGDLDISTIKQRPDGRAGIETKLVRPDEQGMVWKAVRDAIMQGRQAFVVCPAIEQTDASGRVDVGSTATMLGSGPLKSCRVEVMHGQMRPREKDAVMERFVSGVCDVLVSTTVIEVGVDVPNASVMVILGAEHFGLAQLHQLRGRIGRGPHASSCFLCPDQAFGKTLERLRAVEATMDGFALAELDLRLRGAGDIVGTTQSGLPEFRFATYDHVREMKAARDWARRLLDEDPELMRYPLLKERLRHAVEDVHLE